MSGAPAYRGAPLPADPGPEDLRAAVADYEAICAANIRLVVERFEAHAGAYAFVDTKLDLRTGRDADLADPVRGRDTVYGWIQGRGLEALAGHTRWAEDHADPAVHELAPRLRAMAAVVMASLRRLRAANDGHLSFFMTPEGTPFVLGPQGDRRPIDLPPDRPSGYSDLFGAKGLFAAARLLGNQVAEAEAADWMDRVTDDILAGAFRSDQQPLDPTNPVETAPGRHAHGPFMIQLGACALGAASGRQRFVADGLRLLGHELALHANLGGRLAELQEGDFWEFVDDDGRPLRAADGTLRCDPGHALEFVGLAFKFAAAAEDAASPAQRRDLAAATAPLLTILRQVFGLGFRPDAGGICKAYDLIARRPLHPDRPWWCLPATIRAAALAAAAAPDEAGRRVCRRVWAACHNAFVTHYVQPHLHLLAIQNRAADGSVSTAIPATADADPGYHTGLSLLDVIGLQEQVNALA